MREALGDKPIHDETADDAARWGRMLTLKLFTTMSLMAAASTSLSSMRWEKRVLLVSTPGSGDPALEEQRRILAKWKRSAAERDLAVVEIVGDTVSGTNDPAPTIRKRYGLSAAGFMVVLIGKDGGVKLSRTSPIPAAILEKTIDAMPMRRSGER
ncbi:DUF4174 domain-containing protein [Sphingomonas montana]|uniref:DUF4174 domain-containing protein n=1 Tax=Sphingomonas montana TaxID=1843236 RepID=UPI001F0AD2C5|nr:DUF4174 domain-containing protein [Sphingomonas montana]